jgi:hypothetical protein
MKEILKIALGVFLGGGALLIAHAFVDDVRAKTRALELVRQLSATPTAILSAPASPSAPTAPANSCANSKDPACGIAPGAESVSCIIKGEAWRMAENTCVARGGKIE